MSAMASKITSVTIVHSTVCSGANQRKHQSPASLAFVRGIHQGPVNSPHNGPVTRKMFPLDDVIILMTCQICLLCYIYVWRSCLSLEVVSSIPAGSTIIYRFLCGCLCVSLWQSIKIKNQQISISPAPGRSSKLTHTGVEIDTCAFQTGSQLSSAASGMSLELLIIDAISVAWSVRAGQLAAGGVVSVWRAWVRSPPGPR